MNGSFYQNPTFPNNEPLGGKLALEEENDNIRTENNRRENNMLDANKGRKIKVYASFPFSAEWKDKTFEGIIESTEKDSLLISEPTTGKWYIIPISYINYLEFEEKINTL